MHIKTIICQAMFHLFIVLQGTTFPRVAALKIHIAILGQAWSHKQVIFAVRLVRELLESLG